MGQEENKFASSVPLPQAGSAATHTIPERCLPSGTLAATSDEDAATSKDKSFQCLINSAVNSKGLPYLKSFNFTQDSLKKNKNLILSKEFTWPIGHLPKLRFLFTREFLLFPASKA